MKTASSAFSTPLLCGLLLAGIPAVSAQTGTIYESLGDVEYAVHRYDDGDQPNFEVTFTDFEVTSTYEFDVDGFVKFIYADSEKYKMIYRNNGKLRRVKRLSSRRMLEEEQGAAGMTLIGETVPATMDVVGHTDSAPVVRRRLFDCDQCLQTWDVVCGNGLDTVCDLVGYGNPFLSGGELSTELFCNNFGTMCDQRTADDVCQDVCGVEECLAPLTVKVAYESAGESESSTSDQSIYMDLYVIEPGGQTSFWSNQRTEMGYSTTDMVEYTSTYRLFSGLDAGTATGEFFAFVELYQGPTPMSWTVTATDGNGQVVLMQEGEFNDDCGGLTSHVMPFSLNQYVDNGCEEDEDSTYYSSIESHGGGRRALRRV